MKWCIVTLLIFMMKAFPAMASMNTWGGNGNDILSAVSRAENGDFILFAQTNSTTGTNALSSRLYSGKKDGWMLRVTNEGEVISEALLSGEGINNTTILGGMVTSDGTHIIIIESSESEESPVAYTGYMVTHNAKTNGTRKEELLGLPHEVYVSEKGMLVVGAKEIDAYRSMVWCCMIARDGRICWEYCSPEEYGYEPNQMRVELGILREDHAILVMEQTKEDRVIQILRVLDENGRVLRDVCLQSQVYLYIRGGFPTQDGLMFYGYHVDELFEPHGFFCHVDMDGNLQFSKSLAETSVVRTACPSQKGGYYFAENHSERINLFHLDETGEIELLKSYDYDEPVECQSIFEEPDGEIVCMGTLRTDTSALKGVEDIFFLRYTDMYSIVSTESGFDMVETDRGIRGYAYVPALDDDYEIRINGEIITLMKERYTLTGG